MPNKTPQGSQHPSGSYPKQNNRSSPQDFHEEDSLFDEAPSSLDMFGEEVSNTQPPSHGEDYYQDSDDGFDMFDKDAAFGQNPYVDDFDAPSPGTGRGLFGEELPPFRHSAPDLFDEDNQSLDVPDEGLYVGFGDQAPPRTMPPKGAPKRKVYSASKPSSSEKAGPAKPGANKKPAQGAGSNRKPSSSGGAAAEKRKKQRMYIIVGAGIGALVLVLLLAILLPPFLRGGDTSSLSGASSLGADSGYAANEFSIPVDQLQGTILGETEDAGDEYVQDTLFIGDSNTARMVSYRTDTGVTLDNGIGIVGMGITDVTTARVVKFVGQSSQVTIPEAVKIMQPRRVVLTFGTNNAGGISVSSFTDSYKKATDAIKDAYSYADIIIAAIPPIAKQNTGFSSLSQSAIDEFNLALAKLAEAEGYKFLNWTEVLKDSKTGHIKNGYVLGSDGIHLTRTAMTTMFTYFRTHAYIGEDTRPKPLKDIPKRAEVPSPYVAAGDPGGTESEGSDSSDSSDSDLSAVTDGVKVSISTYDDTNGKSGGGTIVYNGSEKSSFAVTVKQGGSAGPFQAKAAAGYAFAGWSAPQDGRINAGSSSTSIQLITSKKGDSVALVAHFKWIGAASSSTPIVPSATTSVAPPASTASVPQTSSSSTAPSSTSTEPPSTETPSGIIPGSPPDE